MPSAIVSTDTRYEHSVVGHKSKRDKACMIATLMRRIVGVALVAAVADAFSVQVS